MHAKPKNYDIVIVGGGMVGLCLALALKETLNVAIIESRVIAFNDSQHDPRALALSYASQELLTALDIWPRLENNVTPLKEIHISERGQLGITRLNAAECGYSHFGAIVPAQILAKTLYDAVASCTHIELITPATIDSVVCDSAQAYLSGPDLAMTSELVVIANGANSELAKRNGILYHTENTGQQALVSTIEVSSPVCHVAYERFVNNEIIALLPLGGANYGVVWSAAEAAVAHLKNISEPAYLAALQQAFGYRVGRFKKIISPRHSYPLQTSVAQKEAHERMVLLGNAAHTLHPAAGQGFNLALRRSAVLAEELLRARAHGDDLANPETLGRYIERTQRGARQVIGFTDSLVHLFSHNANLLRKLRGLGLFLFDRTLPLKKHLVQRAMGVTGYE